MDGHKCVKCKKLVIFSKPYDYKCNRCNDVVLCRECDDRSDTLRWYGHELEEKYKKPFNDEYLCKGCITKWKKEVEKAEGKKETETKKLEEINEIVLNFD